MQPSSKTKNRSTLIEQCLVQVQESNTSLAYFYCDFRNQQTQKEEAVIGAWICQLAVQLDCTPSELEEFASKHETSSGQFSSPSYESLEALLLTLLEKNSSSILAIDALDECEKRSNLISLMRRLAESPHHNVKILVSSRQEGDIEEAFGDLTRQSTRVNAVNEDIDSYIYSALANKRRLQRLSNELRDDIIRSIRHGAGGMHVIF